MRITTVLAVAFLGVTCLGGPPYAYAVIKHYQLDIARQPLDTALNDLAQQTGLQIGRFSERPDGSAVVGPVRGEQTAEGALKILLSHTGLAYRMVSDTTIAVYNPTAAASSSVDKDPGDDANSDPKEGHESRSFRDRFRLARAGTPAADAVAKSSPEASTDSGPAAPQVSDGRVELTTVVVTGTLIHRTDAVSANPLSVVTSDEIKRSDTVTVADIARRLPLVGDQGYEGGVGRQVGTSAIELRGLGVNRTLILVDGLRYTPTITSAGVAVDTNTIPVPLIDHIDILRDGASPIYGSDAVAGVVNIITKRDFQGIRFDASGGLSSQGDRGERQFSLTAGQNFERGNVVASVNYLKRDGLEAGDRAYSRHPIASDSVIGDPHGAYTPIYGDSLISPGGTTFSPTGDFVTFNSPTSFSPLGPNGYENSGKLHATVVTPLETYGGTIQAHYTVAGSAELFAEGNYTHTGQVSSSGIGPEFGPRFSQTYPNAGLVPADNPFNAFGVPIPLYRSYDELGSRAIEIRGETSRGVLGLRGSIFKNDHYQVYYAYGHSRNAQYFHNLLNVPNLINSFDPVLCAAAPGCVVANPFGPGSITPAVADYIRANTFTANDYTQGIAGASLNGDLLTLPAGPMSFAVGAEYRRETGSTNYDALTVNGGSSETVAGPTHASFNAGEAYTELNVPVLADLPAVRSLSIDVAGRYSHYNHFGGATTWKAGLNWAITSDVRIRASHGTAFRAPNVSEFAGGALRFKANYVDPCDATMGLTSDPNVSAACAAAGLPAGFAQLQDKTPAVLQGNVALQPEKAQETNIGVILTPRFAPGLSVQLDYYRIQLTNAINYPDLQTLLSNCYSSGAGLSSPDCARITRDASGQISLINLAYKNVGIIRTDGFDLEADYHFGLSDLKLPLPGTIGVTAAATYLNNFQESNESVPGSPLIQYAGVNGIGSPRLKTTSSLSYSLDRFTGAYTLRYIRGLERHDLDPAQVPAAYLRLADIYYHDLAATYAFDHVDVTAGVQNLFNRTPPSAGQLQSLISYDGVGRFFFVRLSATLW